MSKPTAYLVTGGSAGIGAAIIRMLLEAGHKVVNIDYRLPENPPAGLVSYQADLTDEARTKEVAGEVTAAYNIVGLVNNAGATRPGTADTATLADLDYVVNLHLRTALILVQAALPAMREAGFGRIVNIVSRSVKAPHAELGLSNGARSGLIGF
ncbi:hypothetical protein G6F68_016826 [Rhizopus microsporus]|nr:hypothetical protein G6F68_016826 [Rhizopus microsporus]